MASIFIMACNQGQKEEISDVSNEMEDVVQEVSADMNQEWSALQQNMQAVGTEIDNKITEIDKNLETASDEAAEELKLQREKLVKIKEDVSKRMNANMEEISADWATFKKETEEYISELKRKM